MALLHHAREYAADSLQWAVSEAQRCFQPPLDHTRHGPVEPFPEMVNKPTGNPYFDRMLKSDPGLKFLELTDSRDHVKQIEPDAKRRDLSALSRCLTVEIVDEDGKRKQHRMTLDPSDFDSGETAPKAAPKEETGIEDDTLSKRSSPGAVSAAVQSLKQQCMAVPRDSGELADTAVQCQEEHSKSADAPKTPAKHCTKRSAPRTPRESNGHQMSAANSNLSRELAPAVTSGPSRGSDCKLKLGKPLTNLLSGIHPDAKANPVQTPETRGAWEVGSVLEVFSASNSSWFPAVITQVVQAQTSEEMLTAQFWLNIEDAKQKTLPRDSDLLARLGTHCGDQLPPGFQTGASKSRPGKRVFVDVTTGLKYESLELTWAVHFKRWLEHPTPAGTQTISSVPTVLVSAVRTNTEWSEAGDEAGMMTRVAPEHIASPEKRQREIVAREETSAAAAMYLEAGCEDLEAWASWTDLSRLGLMEGWASGMEDHVESAEVKLDEAGRTAEPAQLQVDNIEEIDFASLLRSLNSHEHTEDFEDEFAARVPASVTAEHSPQKLLMGS